MISSTSNMDHTRTRGIIEAIISSASFGLIPLFSIPVLAAGMAMPSLLVYRFGFGCMAMLIVLLLNHANLRISWSDMLRVCWLALLYDGSAIFLIWGYSYLPSGVATALLFSYPVWTSLIETIFFHERFSASIGIAIVMAVTGVFLLSGFGKGGDIKSAIGVLIELASGLLYAIYMVSVPQLKVRRMGSLKLTFYVFFVGMIFLAIYSLATSGITPVKSRDMLISLVLLGLLPTALSNVSLIMAIKKIGSTMCSILGAFEPLTAMVIGIIVFREPFTAAVAAGFLLIIGAVTILILK